MLVHHTLVDFSHQVREREREKNEVFPLKIKFVPRINTCWVITTSPRVLFDVDVFCQLFLHLCANSCFVENLSAFFTSGDRQE